MRTVPRRGDDVDSMKILIFTFGTRGDVQPYVALGEALQKSGHSVILSTGQGFDGMIVRHGLVPASLSIDFRSILADPGMQDAMRTFSGKVRAWRQFKATFKTHYREMWAMARKVQPDMILGHPKGFAAIHIAEALGVVFVPTTLQPAFSPTTAFPNFLLPFADLGATGNWLSHSLFNRLARWGQSSSLGTFRSEVLGLTEEKSPNFFNGYHPAGKVVPRLHGYSRHILPKPLDWGEADHITGYWFTDPEAAWQPSPDLQHFMQSGPPPVYVGFGSMPAEDAHRQTLIVVEALRLAGRRGVLATGWGGLQRPDGDSDLPRSIFCLDAVPHDWLFPRCSAIVHHGGAGTTHEGLRWGRPSVLCPVTVDQPFWGARIRELGVGPKPIPQKDMTSGLLANAIMEAHSAEIVARAAAIGDNIRWEGGVAAAVAILSTVEKF